MKTIVRALGPLIALAPAGSTLLAETGPESHPDKAIPISAELAKTCRALAIKTPSYGAGGKGSLCTGAAGLFPRLHCQRRQYAMAARRRISRRMALVTRRTWPLIQTLNRFG